MFELSQLRCFVAVAETLHFGQAASRLNMTQPPLSRQVQLLERAVGAPLLERSSRSVRLTPAGRVFLPEARRILRLSESAIRWTQRVWRGEAGTLRIGFTAASGYGMLPNLMIRMRDTMPSVDVVLREMVTAVQLDALSNDVIDIGFVRPPVDVRELETRQFLSEPFVAALPGDHPLCAHDRLSMAALDRQHFIMFSPDAARYFHDLLIAAFGQAQVMPRIVHQVGQIHSMLALVDAGLGVALVPASATKLHFPNVQFRPVDLSDEIVRVNAAWRRANDNPVLQTFLSLIGQSTTE